MFRSAIFTLSLVITSTTFPHSTRDTEGLRNYAVIVHRENMDEIMKFQRRIEEEELNMKYGPAFADSYSYEDKVNVANILRTIRSLHRIGN